MVGSRIGWRETAYLPSPVEPAQLAAACIKLRNGAVRIVPGLSCVNRLGAPDLMRGEETQVLGALRLDPSLQRGRHLLCLPGTHTKWVAIEAGKVISFLTAPAGEVFDLISQHSVLVHGATRSEFDEATFQRGLDEFNRHSNAQLLDLIFQCRSRWMMGDLQPESTASFLSGLLIACDIAGAMQTFATSPPMDVRVIGSAKLTALYAKAFAHSNIEVRAIDGEVAAVAGLFLLHQLSGESHAS
jgi:2-dehydro-3-deoxygalactonokinase